MNAVTDPAFNDFTTIKLYRNQQKESCIDMSQEYNVVHTQCVMIVIHKMKNVTVIDWVNTCRIYTLNTTMYYIYTV